MLYGAITINASPLESGKELKEELDFDHVFAFRDAGIRKGIESSFSLQLQLVHIYWNPERN